MPGFELIPQNEAMLKSTTGKRAQIIAEYVGYIDQLEKGRAGKFQVTEGETTAAIRRRLGAKPSWLARRSSSSGSAMRSTSGRRRNRGDGREGHARTRLVEHRIREKLQGPAV